MFGHPRPNSESAGPTLTVSLTRPVPLASIVLISLDSAAYAFASSDKAAFEAEMERAQAIIREGEVIGITSDRDSARRWKVAMTEPVLQGVFQRGYTRFIVLPSLGGADQGSVESVTTSMPAPENSNVDHPSPSDSDDDEDLEIDESFLAASVLGPSRPSQPSTPLTSPPSKPDGFQQTFRSSQLDQATTQSPQRRTPGSIVLQPQNLQHPVPQDSLVPRPSGDEDDTPRLYLRSADLGRIGVFSGDWLLAEACAAGSASSRRLVRAFAVEGSLAGVLKPEQ